MAVHTGQVLSDYRLLDRIGVGLTGEVWRGQNVHAERLMRAIKIIRPELANDPATRQRFFKGVEHLDSLRHENIVQVHAIRHDGELLYMEMELLTGRTTDKVLKEHSGTMPVAMARDMVRQALAGIGFFHKSGIIHGDVKPSKLFVTDSGAVKVLEGNVAIADTPGAALAEASPAYMAPEIAQGERATAASDIYSMGIVLFELLAGATPFSVDRNLPAPQAAIAMMMQHATKPVPQLRDVRQDVSTRLDAVVRKATAKVPDQRFASARDFELALLALEDEDTTVREKTPGPPSVHDTVPTQEPVRIPTTPPPSAPPVTPPPMAAEPLRDESIPELRVASTPPRARELTPAPAQEPVRAAPPPADLLDDKTPPMGTQRRKPGERAEPSFAMLSPVSGPPPNGRKPRFVVDAEPPPTPPAAPQKSGVNIFAIIGGAVVVGAVVGIGASMMQGGGTRGSGFAATPPAAPAAPTAAAPPAAAVAATKPSEKVPPPDEKPAEEVKAAPPPKPVEAAEPKKPEPRGAAEKPAKSAAPVQLSEAARAILAGKEAPSGDSLGKATDDPSKTAEAPAPAPEPAPKDLFKNANPDAPRPNIDVDKTIGKAAKFMEKGKASKALDLYEQVLDANPTHTDALFGKGLALSEMGRGPDAIAAFKRTLEVNPRFGDAMMSLAEEYKKSGNAKAATETYQKYLDTNPSGPLASQAQQGIDSLK